MPVTVIVGGQFGSEGKGKVAHYLAREKGATVAIRVGGPNSGHTVIGNAGEPLVFRHLPTAAILPDVTCVLPAGTYIDADLLLEEIALSKLPPARLLIDPNAVAITRDDCAEEKSSNLRERIGSTLSGTGAAIRRRLSRDGSLRLAIQEPKLSQYIAPVVAFLRNELSRGRNIVLEGTQGFGLSLLHSPHYPYVTSRDTTAAGVLSETGLSPLDVDDVVLVLRAFPIRVPGNSGPLPDEVNWETVSNESGSSSPLVERTSVTRAIRRVARFDPEIICAAIGANNPSTIVLNHLDYVDASCANGALTQKVEDFVRAVEAQIRARIDLLGVGPGSVLKFVHPVQRLRLL